MLLSNSLLESDPHLTANNIATFVSPIGHSNFFSIAATMPQAGELAVKAGCDGVYEPQRGEVSIWLMDAAAQFQCQRDSVGSQVA